MQRNLILPEKLPPTVITLIHFAANLSMLIASTNRCKISITLFTIVSHNRFLVHARLSTQMVLQVLELLAATRARLASFAIGNVAGLHMARQGILVARLIVTFRTIVLPRVTVSD